MLNRVGKMAWRRALFLLACVGVIVAGRWRLALGPVQADIGAYAVIGHEMMAGRPLYADLWERKPPLLYLTFAGGEVLAGYGRGELLLVNLTATLLTLTGVYAIGRTGGHGNAGGVCAAGLWTLLCADLDLTANQPDPEAFINSCVVIAVVLMLNSSTPSPRRWIRILGTGALLAAATFYKHNAALLCAALLAGHVVAAAFVSWRSVRSAMVEAIAAGAVIVAAWSVFLGHAYLVGRLPATVDVLFRQNVAYSNGSFGHNLLQSLSRAYFFPSFMTWAIGPCALLLMFAVAAVIGRTGPAMGRRGWILCAAWAVGAWMTIALTGHVYAHYYVMWLPVVCVCAGWAAAGLWSARLRAWRAVVVVVAIGVLIRQAQQFSLSPEQWVRRQYSYYDVPGQNAFALQLANFLRPDETFFELGDDNSMYFLTRKSPPSGLLFIDPLIYGDDTAVYWRRLLNDLDRRPPDLVVLSSEWTKFFAPQSPVFAWLRENYDRFPTPLGWPTYRLYVRRGGTLARRLGA